MLFLLPILLTSGQDVEGVVRLADGRPVRDAVVSFQGAEHSTPMRHVVIDQRDRRFIPHVTAVTLNTRVDFPNNDMVFHNVFTEYHSQKFDFGMYARGRTKSQVFDQVGVAVLLCNIHPDMGAFVVCVDTPYFAVTDSKGRYLIHNVPPGEYAASVWHEPNSKVERRVTVNVDQKLDFQMGK
jgi:plastocyanin